MHRVHLVELSRIGAGDAAYAGGEFGGSGADLGGHLAEIENKQQGGADDAAIYSAEVAHAITPRCREDRGAGRKNPEKDLIYIDLAQLLQFYRLAAPLGRR